MPGKQQSALDALKLITMAKEYKARAEKLIQTPKLVNQSTFGVCGMASVLRALLEIEPERFVALLKSIFETNQFTTAEGMTIRLDRAKLQSMFRTNLTKGSSHVELAKNPNKEFELDFVVSRCLGQIAEKMDPHLFKEQVDFTKLFVDPKSGGIKDLLSQGHLALQTKCLEFILEKIVGVTRFRKLKTDTSDAFDRFVTGVNKLFAKSSDTFVIVAINDFSKIFDSVMKLDYNGSGKFIGYSKKPIPDLIANSFDYKNNKHLVKYTHWVVVKKSIFTAGSSYKISFWSWAEDIEDANISKAVAHTYMREVIIACMTDAPSYIDEFDRVVKDDLQVKKPASMVLPKDQSHIPSLAQWNQSIMMLKNKDYSKDIGDLIEKYHKVRTNAKSSNRDRFFALKVLAHKLSDSRHKIREKCNSEFEKSIAKSLNLDPRSSKNISKVNEEYNSRISDFREYEIKSYPIVKSMEDLEEYIKNEKASMKLDYQSFTYIYSPAEWVNESWILFGKRKDIKTIDQAVEDYSSVFARGGAKEERLSALKAVSEATTRYEQLKGGAGSPRMQAVFDLERLIRKESDLLRAT